MNVRQFSRFQYDSSVSHAIVSAGPNDKYHRCRSCGHKWKKRVNLRWPIFIFFKHPWPMGGPWLNSWGIEETGRTKQRYQQTFSRVYRIGPIGIHVGYTRPNKKRLGLKIG